MLFLLNFNGEHDFLWENMYDHSKYGMVEESKSLHNPRCFWRKKWNWEKKVELHVLGNGKCACGNDLGQKRGGGGGGGYLV